MITWFKPQAYLTTRVNHKNKVGSVTGNKNRGILKRFTCSSFWLSNYWINRLQEIGISLETSWLDKGRLKLGANHKRNIYQEDISPSSAHLSGYLVVEKGSSLSKWSTMGQKTPWLGLLRYAYFCLFKPNYNMAWPQRRTCREGSTDSLLVFPLIWLLWLNFLFLPLSMCCFFNRPEDRGPSLACWNGKDTGSCANIPSNDFGEVARRHNPFLVLATCNKLTPYRKERGNDPTYLLKSFSSRNVFLSSYLSKYWLHVVVVLASI